MVLKTGTLMGWASGNTSVAIRRSSFRWYPPKSNSGRTDGWAALLYTSLTLDSTKLPAIKTLLSANTETTMYFALNSEETFKTGKLMISSNS